MILLGGVMAVKVQGMGETDRKRFFTYDMAPFLIQVLVCPIRLEHKD